MVKLDLKKFKHVSSDGKTTKLKHQDGHELVLAHKSLSPEAQKQLEALAPKKSAKTKMADGGVVDQIEKTATYLGNQVKGMFPDSKVTQDYREAPAYKADPQHGHENDTMKKDEDKNSKKKFYADGGDVTADAVPDYTDPMAATQNETQAEKPKNDVDPDLARKRQIYNSLLDQNPASLDSGMAARTGVPDDAGASNANLFGPQGQEPKDFSPENWAEAEKTYGQEQVQNAAQIVGAQQQAIKLNAARTAAGLAPVPVPNVPEGPQMPGTVGNPPPNTPQQDLLNPSKEPTGNPAINSEDPEAMLRTGFKQQLAGINQEAAAKGALGAQQAEVLKRSEDAQLSAKAAYQNQYKELEQERQAHMQDIRDGYIDPNKYWTGDKNGNGSHSKVAAGIGMILAGFNPTSKPNAAIDYLKYQMDQNMAAQKENLGAKQNMLTANLRQFGNLRDATDMTRIMQHDIMSNELQQAAAKATSPMAKAAALQAAGQLQTQMAPLFQQFAMRRAMMGLSQSGSPDAVEHTIRALAGFNPEQAKIYSAAFVPGVGLSRSLQPIPEKVRDQIVQHDAMSATVKDLQQFVSTHSTIIPGTPDYNVGQQKAKTLQSAVREGKLGTVYREGEQPLLDQFVNSNPAGAMKMLKTVPQLNELLSSNERDSNILKKNYGLPTSHDPAVQNGQGQPKIKIVNGIKYMRGPNGEAIKVK